MEETPINQRNKQNQNARNHIVTAMMQLIREKPISSITIQELTELAGVSRMTFYRNYSSKEDILISSIHNILTVYQQDDTTKNRCGHFYDKDRIRRIFSYFYKYKDFINALIYCGFSDIFLHDLTEFAVNKWVEDKNNLAEKNRLITYVGSMFNSYLNWIQPPQTLTLDELTDLVYSVCVKAYAE